MRGLGRNGFPRMTDEPLCLLLKVVSLDYTPISDEFVQDCTIANSQWFLRPLRPETLDSLKVDGPTRGHFRLLDYVYSTLPIPTPRKIFIWFEQILVESNIFYLWYMVKQIFVWFKYIICLHLFDLNIWFV